MRFACRDRTVNLSTEQSLYLSNRENNDDDGGLGGEHAGHGADENVSEPAALAHVPREGVERPCFLAPVRYALARARVAINRLELDTSIYISLRRLRAHQWTRQDKCKYLIMAGVALFSLSVMERPGYPLKLVLPLLYALAVLVPVTSQFVLPATPILTWLMLFYSAQFVPVRARPHIWVSLLPTLERVWFGASISELLVVGGTSSIAHTRSVGNRILDICAWIPYGIVHYCAPFFVATALFILAPPGSVKFFAAAFGFLNMIGVLIQIALPCVPPCTCMPHFMIQPCDNGLGFLPLVMPRDRARCSSCSMAAAPATVLCPLSTVHFPLLIVHYPLTTDSSAASTH